MPTEFDAIDRRILAQLQEDASLTNESLARLVHVSPATCLRRVRRLRESGVIERTVAILSPEAVGQGLAVIVEITLEQQNTEWLARFEVRAMEEAAVQQCYRTSSGPDFVLILHVASMDDYHALAHRLLSADAHVRNVRAFFAVKRSKFATALPLRESPVS
ncbi:Lrp/AsnC family transcriptional regulator [Uliginosibacterium sp. sgz301328]|uniref:Lrp/AsnC family transcriptional regulator n=1 Tax=Uliginosibacterium sp. sgz301328 TaxID=3243764 RepID=UPI00359E2281